MAGMRTRYNRGSARLQSNHGGQYLSRIDGLTPKRYPLYTRSGVILCGSCGSVTRPEPRGWCGLCAVTTAPEPA